MNEDENNKKLFVPANMFRIKRTLVFLFLILLSGFVNGQESYGLVYFNKFDSIEFKINKKDSLKAYSVKNEDSCRIALYPKLPNSVLLENKTNATLLYKPDKLKFRLGIDGGLSYRIAPIDQKLPDEIFEYKKKLRSGKHIGIDMIYFFNTTIGLGLKYSLFVSDNSSDLQKLNDQLVFRSDNLSVHYIGPFFSMRSVVKRNKVYANFDFSLGQSFYINNIVFDDETDIVSDANFGFVSNIGADFMLSNNLSVGWNFAVSAASFSKIKYNESLNLPDTGNDNLSRVSLGLTLRYYTSFKKK